jgi:6-phosphogluconolactonase
MDLAVSEHQALGERGAWVTSIIGAKPEPRSSLTYPALESSLVVYLIRRKQKGNTRARSCQ